jgi:hypothetical protein
MKPDLFFKSFHAFPRCEVFYMSEEQKAMRRNRVLHKDDLTPDM